jgi:hypothetical protein
MQKLQWNRVNNKPGYWLQFDVDAFVSGYDLAIAEVTAWCKETDCGKRMAYDMYQFKSEADMTAFLLRWS